MGRSPRLQFAGACYFVELRGNNRQDLFFSGQDRRHFLALLKAAKARYGLTVYAYCLMNSHVSLLVETARPNLSVAMQGFNTAYTKHFNAAHNTSGHLFQGRYKCLLVDKDHFLADMTRYIHLAPARAGLKEKPWRYQWSSGAAYVESHVDEAIVDSEKVLAQFGKIRIKQSVRYLQYMKERMRSASEWVLPVARGAAIGSEAFLSRMSAKGEDPADKPASRTEVLRIVGEVAAKHGIDAERVLGRAQWREVTAARHEAMRRLWHEARLRVVDIARLFGRTPALVSGVLKRAS